MNFQTAIFILIGLVGYFGQGANSSIPLSNLEKATEQLNGSLDFDLQLETYSLGHNIEHQVESSEFGLNRNADRRTETFNSDQYIEKIIQSSNFDNNGRRSETSYIESNIEQPTKTSNLGLLLVRRTEIHVPYPGIAYGYVTDKIGYQCAYFVPGHRDQHGPRYLLIRCSITSGDKTKFYGCDYRGYPTSCKWYNKARHAKSFYREMANHIAKSNNGHCVIQAIIMHYCPDVKFRRV